LFLLLPDRDIILYNKYRAVNGRLGDMKKKETENSNLFISGGL